MGRMDRYTVISADCHGGGAVLDYRPYCIPPPRGLRRVGRGFDNPYDDLDVDDASRNWDPDRGCGSSRPTASSPR